MNRKDKLALDAEFGKNLAAIRMRKGLTQKALAEKAGINRVTIAMIETGRNGVSLPRIMELSQALEVKPWALFP